MKTGALVLAAGMSRRFGSDKRRYRVAGKPLLQRTVEGVLAARLDCRVCIRPGDGDVPLWLDLAGIEFLECAGAAGGMGDTLAEGARACADWDALLVVLGDMAWVRSDTLAAVAAALTPHTMVQPVHGDRPGQPVGFGRDFFPALARLTGDRGGRDILASHPAAVLRLAIDDPGIHRDLDTPPA